MKGHVRERSPRTWLLKYDAPSDDGHRRTKYATVHGGRKDAERELRRILREIDTGIWRDVGRLTVGDYLAQWLAARRHSISPKTHERYGELVNRHIVPALGAVALAKLSASRLNAFYADKLDHGRLDGAGGLSPQTVRHLDRLLHKALADAVRQGLLAVSPADAVERPKVERRAKRTLADDELARLLAAARGGPLFAPLYLILASGMRRGECLALQWRSVNLDDASLQVVSSVEETRAGSRIKPTKTDAGRRTIALPASAVDVLRRHRVDQQQLFLACGARWSVDALVFPAPDGSLRRPRNFTKAITSLAKRAGLDGFSPHCGRHDHFTRLLAAGVHPKVAQLRAGHSSITVTMDTYSHAVAGLQEAAAEQIDDVLRTADGG